MSEVDLEAVRSQHRHDPDLSEEVRDLLDRLVDEVERLRERLLEHACSCIGTEAAESGYGLEPERHEKLCGYRVALHTEANSDPAGTPEPKSENG